MFIRNLIDSFVSVVTEVADWFGWFAVALPEAFGNFFSTLGL